MIDLKAFCASTSKTVSAESSLKIFSIACIAASDPASCPTYTWSDPAEETTSFLSTDNVPVILRRIYPTRIGRKPRFLSRGMRRHATDVSMETADTFSVQIFLIKLAVAFLRSTFALPKLFEHRILLHLSASTAKGPDPPFALMVAFLIISSWILTNMIEWTSCGIPVKKTLLLAFFDVGCFSFNLFSVSLVSGSIPSCMLLVSNFTTVFILPFFIYFLNFAIVLQLSLYFYCQLKIFL